MRKVHPQSMFLKLPKKGLLSGEIRTNYRIWLDRWELAGKDMLGHNFRSVADDAFKELGTFGLSLLRDEGGFWPGVSGHCAAAIFLGLILDQVCGIRVVNFGKRQWIKVDRFKDKRKTAGQHYIVSCQAMCEIRRHCPTISHVRYTIGGLSVVRHLQHIQGHRTKSLQQINTSTR